MSGNSKTEKKKPLQINIITIEDRAYFTEILISKRKFHHPNFAQFIGDT